MQMYFNSWPLIQQYKWNIKLQLIVSDSPSAPCFLKVFKKIWKREEAEGRKIDTGWPLASAVSTHQECQQIPESFKCLGGGSAKLHSGANPGEGKNCHTTRKWCFNAKKCSSGLETTWLGQQKAETLIFKAFQLGPHYPWISVCLWGFWDRTTIGGPRYEPNGTVYSLDPLQSPRISARDMKC